VSAKAQDPDNFGLERNREKVVGSDPGNLYTDLKKKLARSALRPL
jgi:hypothetical protein